MNALYILAVLIMVIILLFLSAFFSAAEIAIFSSNKFKLMNLRDSGDHRARILLDILDKPDKVLAAILIMNNLVNILTSSVVAIFMFKLMGSIGLSISIIVVTLARLLLGEIIPKTQAIRYPETIALKMSLFLKTLVIILNPIIWVLIKISKIDTELFTEKYTHSNTLTHAELKAIISVSNEQGVIDYSEKEMLDNVFNFRNRTIRDIMTQRLGVIAIDINTSYEDLLSIIKTHKYSRLPVYKENIDSILGVINVKDFVFMDECEDTFNVSNYIRNIEHTFEFKKPKDVLVTMNKSKSHMCIVIDEYGSTMGLVTMEDIIEQIVGEIDDEYDTVEDKPIIMLDDGEYLVNGNQNIEEINTLLNLKLDGSEYDSLGGLFMKHLNRFPNVNDIIEFDDCVISISHIDNKSIKKLKLILKK